MRRLRPRFAALCLAIALTASGVAAQDASDRDRARALGTEALARFEQGRWADAYTLFAAADGHLHAPTLVLFMARCKRKLGELLNARKLYESVVREPIGSDAPEQFKTARAEAERELAEVVSRTPSLVVVVRAAPDARARITLDGQPRDALDVAKGIAVDPGVHEVAVSASGRPSLTRRVELAEAGTERVVLELNATDAAPEAHPSTGGSLVPAGVAFAFGGAALGMGIVTGAIAKGKVDDLESRCIDGHCPEADRGEADTVRTLTTLSTIGFVGAGAGICAGIVLAIVRPGGGAHPAQARTSLHLTPTGAWLSRTF